MTLIGLRIGHALRTHVHQGCEQNRRYDLTIKFLGNILPFEDFSGLIQPPVLLKHRARHPGAASAMSRVWESQSSETKGCRRQTLQASGPLKSVKHRSLFFIVRCRNFCRHRETPTTQFTATAGAKP